MAISIAMQKKEEIKLILILKETIKLINFHYVDNYRLTFNEYNTLRMRAKRKIDLMEKIK